MARSHLFRPLTDSAGNLLDNCTITVYMADSVALLAQAMFTTLDGIDQLTNPFTTTTGFLDVWLDTPQRVYLQVDAPGFGDETDLYLKVDVFPPPEEIVTVMGGILKIMNTPQPGDVLYASTTVGEAEWGAPNAIATSQVLAGTDEAVH